MKLQNEHEGCGCFTGRSVAGASPQIMLYGCWEILRLKLQSAGKEKKEPRTSCKDEAQG